MKVGTFIASPATATRYDSLAGRRVLITGGASGIGAELVSAFARQGCIVGCVDRDEAAAASLSSDLAAQGLPEPLLLACDLRDVTALQQQSERFVAEVGGIDVLVNNAASDDRHVWEDVTAAYWDERMTVNLRHQFFAAQAAARHMRAQERGSIINFTSTSWIRGVGNMIAYSTAKSAIVGLTRSLARDLGSYNIRCNAVAPGWIMTRKQREQRIDAEGERRLLDDQCLKRLLLPEDISPLVLFLASDDSFAITGQTLIADGGIA